MDPIEFILKTRKFNVFFLFVIALGSIAALLAVVKAFHVSYYVAGFGTLVILAMFHAVFIFEQSRKLSMRPGVRPIALFTHWAWVVLVILSAYLFASSVFFGFPLKVPGTSVSAHHQSLGNACVDIAAAHVYSNNQQYVEAKNHIVSGYGEAKNSRFFSPELCERIKLTAPEDSQRLLQIIREMQTELKLRDGSG